MSPPSEPPGSHVARVAALLLIGATCAACLSATMGRAALEVALIAVATTIPITRPAARTCAICGSNEDVVARQTSL